ncbi:hypothetical protein [Botrimarina sp.]|uniref:hypothetical protein n=1 Tax=Botrimarina sp. TaxID=2795802 RepID=UPI0032ED4526
MLIGGWLAASPAAAAERVYQIGNSFTWDSRPAGIHAMSRQTATELSGGYHIRCNGTLSGIAGSESTCVPPTDDGVWQQALPGADWDHVIVQPWAGGTTLQSDLASITTFRDAALQNSGNADAQWHIYQAWPFFVGDQKWSDWYSDAGSYTAHRQDYFRDLQARLAEEGIAASIIPNADVLAYVRSHVDEFDALESPDDIYRDHVHLSPVGSFIVGTTVLTALVGEDVTGVTETGYGANLSVAARNQIQRVAWKIVNAVQNPGDLNADGVADAQDYAQWSAAFGGSDAGLDGNLDGLVNAADYTLWRDRLATQAVGVPEPGGEALLWAALVAGLAGWGARSTALPVRRLTRPRRSG